MKNHSSKKSNKGKTNFRTPRFFKNRDRRPKGKFAKKFQKIKKLNLRPRFKFKMPSRFPSRNEGHGKNN